MYEDFEDAMEMEQDEEALSAVHALCEEKAVIAATLGANAVICGAWVWATFAGKPEPEARETLKTQGFKWAAKKGKWYFAGKPRSNRRPMSYEYIAAKYGEDEVKARRSA